MARRGWSRGRGCAALLLAGALTVGGAGCSSEAADRAQSLQPTLTGLDGVAMVEVSSATPTAAARIEITLEDGLDATDTVAVLGDVSSAAQETRFTGYRLDVHRSVTEDDLLVVDETFAGSDHATVVTANWIRTVSAFLGDVEYSFQTGNETIAVESGAAIGHDVAEASRIGYGWSDTTWRFHGAPATYVVSQRVTRRDVALFDRVQRSVTSSILPVPATRWRLERRSSHLTLDLEVRIPGGSDPDRIALERWADALRPLAVAALHSTRYPDRPRWIEISDVAGAGRDTFASWSSLSKPVRGRDRHVRGWDAWWERLADPAQTAR